MPSSPRLKAVQHIVLHQVFRDLEEPLPGHRTWQLAHECRMVWTRRVADAPAQIVSRIQRGGVEQISYGSDNPTIKKSVDLIVRRHRKPGGSFRCFAAGRRSALPLEKLTLFGAIYFALQPPLVVRVIEEPGAPVRWERVAENEAQESLWRRYRRAARNRFDGPRKIAMSELLAQLMKVTPSIPQDSPARLRLERTLANAVRVRGASLKHRSGFNSMKTLAAALTAAAWGVHRKSIEGRIRQVRPDGISYS